MLLIISVRCCAEYKIVQRSEDGRYYLTEDTVLVLANYIAKLEDLNNNYKLQITNLEQQVANLKELLNLQKTETESYKLQLEQAQKELQKYKTSTTTWVVVASVAIGTSLILLFVK